MNMETMSDAVHRSSLGQGMNSPPSPVTSGGSSSGVTRLSRYGSISTLATSNMVDGSEWDKRLSSTASLDFEEPESEVRLPVSQRPKGHYSLSDFYIHRTLGTGSFGRVHLGSFSPYVTL